VVGEVETQRRDRDELVIDRIVVGAFLPSCAIFGASHTATGSCSRISRWSAPVASSFEAVAAGRTPTIGRASSRAASRSTSPQEPFESCRLALPSSSQDTPLSANYALVTARDASHPARITRKPSASAAPHSGPSAAQNVTGTRPLRSDKAQASWTASYARNG
jgi:hypothetical protein